LIKHAQAYCAAYTQRNARITSAQEAGKGEKGAQGSGKQGKKEGGEDQHELLMDLDEGFEKAEREEQRADGVLLNGVTVEGQEPMVYCSEVTKLCMCVCLKVCVCLCAFARVLVFGCLDVCIICMCICAFVLCMHIMCVCDCTCRCVFVLVFAHVHTHLDSLTQMNKQKNMPLLEPPTVLHLLIEIMYIYIVRLASAW